MEDLGPDDFSGTGYLWSYIGNHWVGSESGPQLRRAKGFGMKVFYYSRSRREQIENELGVQYAGFDRLLTESDFITAHVSLTPETYHLIGERELQKMKRTAVSSTHPEVRLSTTWRCTERFETAR